MEGATATPLWGRAALHRASSSAGQRLHKTPGHFPSIDDQGRVSVEGKFFAHGARRFRVRGVTYGPFAPDSTGAQVPSQSQVETDFDLMRAASVNAIRTYHVPPERLLAAAAERGLQVFVDIPWSKHLCFLDSKHAQADARSAVRTAVQSIRSFSNVLACSIGNEIPANIVRWHGAAKVERFLSELADVLRNVDPGMLVTYANFPPTEYLNLSFLDFVTFNVYLHDPSVFRSYLQRLQNVVGEKPLVIGELGMDTLRHGPQHQATFLSSHLAAVDLAGAAGAFVFAWTDDWFTGGYQIENWAFGITERNRRPKPSYAATQDAFQAQPVSLLDSVPRISVVVCSYNGGMTLHHCLESLLALDYPDYEVIVVDDGSTDDTRAILASFPTVRAISQENRGLSAARNVGLRAATGSIVAYTDSDCFVDRDWLTLLAAQFEATDAAAVGGPNFAPDDGWLAACVAASPGQPAHVLENDRVAEHIPGCNMAFRREVLLAIDGFDYQYRKAGDDVDICWRLQQAGYWITFAPGAFVWHHRRQTPRAYLRQQAGYGEAEALLRFKHPDRFNGRGDGKWAGFLYGASMQGLRIEEPIIYRGMFGTGLFQCIYRTRPSHWAMLPSTLEWHLVVLLCGLALPIWPTMWMVAGCMLLLSIVVAVLQAAQVSLQSRYDSWKARAVVALLCYLQPLVRSWNRQQQRLFSYRPPPAHRETAPRKGARVPFLRRRIADYWSEAGIERTELLGLLVAYLHEKQWSKTIDTGWKSWDVEVFCHPWIVVRIATAEEEHGSGRRLIRIGYSLRPSGYTQLLWAFTGIAALLSLASGSRFYAGAAFALLFASVAACWHGSFRAGRVASFLHAIAVENGLSRCFTSRPCKHNKPGCERLVEGAA